MASKTPIRTISNYVCHTCRTKLRHQALRPFSTTTPRPLADDGPSSVDDIFSGIGTQRHNRRDANLRNSPENQYQRDQAARRSPGSASSTSSELMNALEDTSFNSLLTNETAANLDAINRPQAAHRLHVYATKHNTHLTLVQPPRAASETASLRVAGTKQSATEGKKVVDTLISLSTGNIGFKKAGRGSFDAAFQLAAFVLRQMGEKGMTNEIRELQVVLRGFGAGREAVTKALLGTEGRGVRGKVRAVVDATRLKQGGPRSKKPRRLG
ncbi:uncharacterized protein LTR77_006971 [Saxophila tyrrhenica]|uniref:Ribosomal protein S11 n=1 Tax=Saxophila tyrrhenica TaxID=1690608 RepID=A0AAV9PAE2_9PEZI|nr:hypothetical protein LTR77_006971 [Saxophila tyrrhenica]